MKNKRKSLLFLLATLTILTVFAVGTAFALGVGSTVSNVQLKDSNDKATAIPDLGNKVITIFYNDPDVADINDPAGDALKAQKFPKDKYRGLGIGNLKDTWKPNSIIRMIARKKEAKFNSTILMDENYALKKAWDLGNADEQSFCIIIDKNKKVIYFYKGKMNAAEIQKAIDAIKAAIK